MKCRPKRPHHPQLPIWIRQADAGHFCCVLMFTIWLVRACPWSKQNIAADDAFWLKNEFRKTFKQLHILHASPPYLPSHPLVFLLLQLNRNTCANVRTEKSLSLSPVECSPFTDCNHLASEHTDGLISSDFFARFWRRRKNGNKMLLLFMLLTEWENHWTDGFRCNDQNE